MIQWHGEGGRERRNGPVPWTNTLLIGEPLVGLQISRRASLPGRALADGVPGFPVLAVGYVATLVYSVLLLAPSAKLLPAPEVTDAPADGLSAATIRSGTWSAYPVGGGWRGPKVRVRGSSSRGRRRHHTDNGAEAIRGSGLVSGKKTTGEGAVRGRDGDRTESPDATGATDEEGTPRRPHPGAWTSPTKAMERGLPEGSKHPENVDWMSPRQRAEQRALQARSKPESTTRKKTETRGVQRTHLLARRQWPRGMTGQGYVRQEVAGSAIGGGPPRRPLQGYP